MFKWWKILPLVAAVLLVACGGEPAPQADVRNDEVHFDSLRFAQAQQMAAEQEKMLLVDVYADWCAPCKRLEKEVFATPAAAAVINPAFVSIRIDGEKGEGPEFVEAHKVSGYPTVIVFDSNGEEIDRLFGYGDPEQWMEQLTDYMAGRNTLSDLKAQVAESPDDLELHHALARKYESREDDANARRHYQRVADIAAAKGVGDDQAALLREVHYTLATFAMKLDDDPAPMRDFMTKTDNIGYLRAAYGRLASYYDRAGDSERAISVYEEAVEKMPDDVRILNGYAWFIFKEELSDHYGRGIALAEKAVALSPEADHIWDTLAQLYFANGQRDKAIEAMEKAIAINPDQASYQRLLKEYMGTEAS